MTFMMGKKTYNSFSIPTLTLNDLLLLNTTRCLDQRDYNGKVSSLGLHLVLGLFHI
jgi:hypothetical protein